ncbi:hypothetical protein COPCOM_00370 [Coprococcus comes ATCC 27758]|uniref:Uncharacterized protein n=1 Tax=Coprococcus comes ATCC 27758 TaxID=470146 RepID=C0B5E9_9FIRM|nr:hypothetical protein COPCOM_00370 [Coprococcus comes ATCC 27758]
MFPAVLYTSEICHLQFLSAVLTTSKLTTSSKYIGKMIFRQPILAYKYDIS